MKERPIIMTAESVRAILEGRNTQTRRVIKPQPPQSYEWQGRITSTTGSSKEIGCASWRGDLHQHLAKPLYIPGDRLWVRETWGIDPNDYGWGEENRKAFVAYRSTDKHENEPYYWGWNPSIHMPRWASRITLEITSVRVERVQEISRLDAIQEGVHFDQLNNYGTGSIEKDAFAELWDRLNAKRGYPWAANPWVWVVEFRRL